MTRTERRERVEKRLILAAFLCGLLLIGYAISKANNKQKGDAMDGRTLIGCRQRISDAANANYELCIRISREKELEFNDASMVVLAAVLEELTVQVAELRDELRKHD